VKNGNWTKIRITFTHII